MRETQKTTSRKSGKGAGPRAKSGSPGARKGGLDAIQARVDQIRQAQREAGHFDCFGRAREAYCDQGECMYREECLDLSPRLP